MIANPIHVNGSVTVIELNNIGLYRTMYDYVGKLTLARVNVHALTADVTWAAFFSPPLPHFT